MIDSHIHLFQYDHIENKIEQWQKEGIHQVVAVSNDLKSAYKTLELKRRFPAFILAGVGYHPEQKPMGNEEKNELAKLIISERQNISLLGEIGLPYYKLSGLTKDEQALHFEQFAWWVDVANRENLPIAIHAVHSQAAEALRILKRNPNVRAHFHWLKAPISVVQDIIDRKHFISITPEICYRERDQLLAKFVPLSQLLIETDGPWRFNGPFANIETSPLLLKPIVQKLSQLKHQSEHLVMKQTEKNAQHLYGKP